MAGELSSRSYFEEPISSAEVISQVGARPHPPARQSLLMNCEDTRGSRVHRQTDDHLSLTCIKERFSSMRYFTILMIR
jgi:hypothetical protein